MVHNYSVLPIPIKKSIPCLKLQVIHAIRPLVLRQVLNFFCLCADPGRRVHIHTGQELDSIIGLSIHHGGRDTYRSMQEPEKRAPTRRHLKPFCSKSLMYQGSMLAERRRIRPSSFRAWLNFSACAEASVLSGSNQSIESMTYKRLGLIYFQSHTKARG